MRISRRRRWAVAFIGALLLAPAHDASTSPEPAAARSREPLLTAPVATVDVVRGASIPAQPWQPGHRGVDLATSVGATVEAPADGTVLFVGQVAGRGVVTVAVGVTGMRTTLEPVDATTVVGAHLAHGQAVGTVSAAAVDPEVGHCAPQACLHWGLREGDAYLDPLDWTVGWGPIRLKQAVS